MMQKAGATYVGRASRGQWNLGVCLGVVFSLLLGERERPENAAEVRKTGEREREELRERQRRCLPFELWPDGQAGANRAS